MINPYAIGKTIYLRAPRKEDLDGRWHEWLSDPEITEFLADRYWPNSYDAQKDFFETIANSKERLVLSVCLIENDQKIGVCNLSSINWLHRFADIAFLIGEKKYQNGTITIELMSLMLQIAFQRLNLLNLKSVHLSVHPSTPIIEKIFGFKECGRLKKIYNYKGEYVDSVISQLSKVEWMERNTNVNN
jgi:ribosomal-protein-alanine N-acetyltransferase